MVYTQVAIPKTTKKQVAAKISKNLYGQNPVLGMLEKYDDFESLKSALPNDNLTLIKLVEQIENVLSLTQSNNLRLKIPAEFTNLRSEITSGRKNEQKLLDLFPNSQKLTTLSRVCFFTITICLSQMQSLEDY